MELEYMFWKLLPVKGGEVVASHGVSWSVEEINWELGEAQVLEGCGWFSSISSLEWKNFTPPPTQRNGYLSYD